MDGGQVHHGVGQPVLMPLAEPQGHALRTMRDGRDQVAVLLGYVPGNHFVVSFYFCT
jgi:hypothetical protein